MNYQNIPRSDKIVKRAFVPKLDALLYFDYKSIEPRLLAYYLHMLGDPGLAQSICSGEDVYVSLARSALGIAGRPLSDEERQVGKTIYLAMCYGGGAPTLMRNLGIEYPEARDILDTFHENMPGIKTLQFTLATRLQERGYIETLYKRQLRPLEDRKAINALIQGSAADVMKAALVRLHREMADMTSHMVSVVHDEVQIDAIESEIPVLVERVPEWMREQQVNPIVPILVDCEISYTNWAEKAPYEERRAVA